MHPPACSCGETETTFRHEAGIGHSFRPDILGGTPVFAGTRVPVRSLLDHWEAGDSLDDFLEGFPSVRRDQAIAVLEALRQEVLSPV